MFNSDTVTQLEYQGRTLTLVGTAHVSKKSVEEVEHVIDTLRPDTVCVELDQTRYDNLIDEDRFRKLDIFQIIRQQKALYFLSTLTLSAFQKKLGDKLGVKPGAEMHAAINKAKTLDATLVLADRDIQATLKRTWANLSFWNRSELLSALIAGFFSAHEIEEDQIEQMKDKDTIGEMMKEFAKAMPKLQGPLIDERDRYLMSAVREAPGKNVVAVVGAAHVEGMKKYLNEPVDRAQLSVIPPPTLLSQILKWLIPLVILASFYWGWKEHSNQRLLEMINAWVLPTAVLSGLGTLLSGGKPLTVLCAMISAPITTLHPAIGVGMVVAPVEAWLRKPTVEDCEQIPTAIATFRGVFKNPFTRVLIVAVGSSLGAVIGMWIGTAGVLKLL
ncbi:MAG TPA: TraB/GumN family protein [Polyangiaceae bacterium]|nr:TraB/GumN family protein [Polyangiaceae bacterium]